MLSKRKVVLGAAVIIVTCLVGVAQRVTKTPSATRLSGTAETSLGTAGAILCSPYIGSEYDGGALTVYCDEDKGSKTMSFVVLPNNNPSPAIVLSYINPYVMTTRQISVLPEMSTSQKYWNTRILIRYDAAGKITGIRYQATAQ